MSPSPLSCTPHRFPRVWAQGDAWDRAVPLPGGAEQGRGRSEEAAAVGAALCHGIKRCCSWILVSEASDGAGGPHPAPFSLGLPLGVEERCRAQQDDEADGPSTWLACPSFAASASLSMPEKITEYFTFPPCAVGTNFPCLQGLSAPARCGQAAVGKCRGWRAAGERLGNWETLLWGWEKGACATASL